MKAYNCNVIAPRILDAVRLCGASGVPVPVIFRKTGATSDAFTPNLVNFQIVNGDVYFPKQFAPKDAIGKDLLERISFSRLAHFGVSEVPTLDDWELFHILRGEVHCGSAVVRKSQRNWWEFIQKKK